MKKILVTGGAGFVGSNLALMLKQAYPDCEIVVFDNLYRKGSEFNLPRLKDGGVSFVHGDVRIQEQLRDVGAFDFLLECSAEPSVLAGHGESPEYLIQTNLNGALNCAEQCRQHGAGMIFLSTSRVYPLQPLRNLNIEETDRRFELSDTQPVAGVSQEGITEDFPISGCRSLYGGTKYAAEIMLSEYRDAYGLPIVINRCGVIAGPWQFGKSDQGFIAFWIGAHLYGKPLKYIGFGGHGRQVRDVLHIDDLADLVLLQIQDPAKFSGDVFNVGGGRGVSTSLCEFTQICAELTGNRIEIGSQPETRYADIPVYLSDTARIRDLCGWHPARDLRRIAADTLAWIRQTPEVQALFA